MKFISVVTVDGSHFCVISEVTLDWNIIMFVFKLISSFTYGMISDICIHKEFGLTGIKFSAVPFLEAKQSVF
jgi:hypothetical protein